MKLLFSLLVFAGLSLVANAEIFWSGVWYHTITPTPSDRLQGGLEVRLFTNGTVQANFIRKFGQGYRSEPSEIGTWTLKKPGVYEFTFDVFYFGNGVRFAGTIKKNLMTGRLVKLGPRGNAFYAGRFQCTLFDDED